MSFTFRETTDADLTYIRRLNFLTDVFGDESKDPDPAEFAEGTRFYVHAWEPERGGVIAVETALENPAGAAWFIFGDEDNHGEGYVASDVPELAIAVEARYRGRGLAGELLDRAATLARDRGCPGISLCVHADNAGARRVYEREGWELVREAGDSPYAVMVLNFSR